MLNIIENKLIGYKNLIGLENTVKVGDALVLHYENQSGYWKLRKFTGLCLSITGKGIHTRVTLVNIINNIRVEYSFFLYNLNIIKIESLNIKKFKKIRRSKLFFLRRKRPLLSKI